jgi:RHS repeat-associated protein
MAQGYCLRKVAIMMTSSTWARSLALAALVVLPSTSSVVGACESNQDCPVGKPIDVTTGNVYLAHVDVVLPTVRGAIEVRRNYNSMDAYAGRSGLFGPGWTSTYEQTISPTTQPGVLILRTGDRTPVYYYDNGHGFYKALSPITEQSTLFPIAGGGLERRFPDGSKQTFDANGRWTASSDSFGNVTSIGRDAAGKLTAVTDTAGGRSITFQYDGANRLHTISGPPDVNGVRHVVVTYGYDASSGAVNDILYADGSGYTITYGVNTSLRTIFDKSTPPIAIEAHDYDQYGRGWTSEVADGVERLEITFNTTRTTVKNALNDQTFYDFQNIAGQNKVSTITHGTEVTQIAYDANARETSERGPAGGMTYFGYYPSGRLATWVDPMNNATSIGYDDQGRIDTIVLPNGGTTTTTYFPAGPHVVTQDVNATDRRTTTYTYTARGEIETITDPRSKVTRFTYWPSGDLKTVQDPLMRTWSYEYDLMGRRTKVTDPLTHGVTTDYDDRGRVKKITYPDPNVNVNYTYDGGGRLKTMTDGLNHTTTNSYDKYGRLKEVKDALDQVTQYTYDVMSNVIAMTDARGNVTTYKYDAAGRRMSMTSASGLTETYTYDAAGRLWKMRDRNGTVATYTYDGLGRVVAKEFSDGTVPVFYRFDSLGALEFAANGTDTLRWMYDLAGQPIQETSGRSGVTVKYGYDLAGNRTMLSTSDGATGLAYEYDDASQLRHIKRGSADFVFDYWDDARRRALTYPNNVATSYNYDTSGRLAEISASRGSTVITNTAYTYDSASNRRTKTMLGSAETYDYDSTNQLIGVHRPASSQDWTYTYDGVGNHLTELTGTTGSFYGYNKQNELIAPTSNGVMRIAGRLNEPGAVTVQGQAAKMLAGNMFEAYVPAGIGVNSFTVVAVDGSGNAATKNYRVSIGGNNDNYTYDANGNLTVKVVGGVHWAYQWDAENHLKRVLKEGAEVARFEYDAIGRRVEKVASGATHEYVYAADEIQRETVSGSVAGVYAYVHGPGIDEHLARYDVATSLYYQLDGLYNVIDVTDSTGQLVSNRQYNAWGAPDGGSLDDGYSFTGREWDSSIGLYYYRARYYDPVVKRFISEDPIGLSGGINLYRYVLNAPQNLTDAFGLKPGDVYGTKEAAAIDALEDIREPTMVDGVEYAGVIYQRADGLYSYSPPAEGDQTRSDPMAGAAMCPTKGKGAAKTLAGLYHSHPKNTSGTFRGQHMIIFSEEFSDMKDENGNPVGDVPTAKRTGLPSYLLTGEGNMKQYLPGISQSNQGGPISRGR